MSLKHLGRGTKKHERPYPGDGKPLIEVPWASDDQHVAALHVVDDRAENAEDRATLAEMLGYDTAAMRERYERGVADRRVARRRRDGYL